MFIYKYKHENVIEYKKMFFKKISLFLSYFIKYSKNSFIFKNNYLDNSTIKKTD